MFLVYADVGYISVCRYENTCADLKDSVHTIVINHTEHEAPTSLLYNLILLLQGKPDKNQELIGKFPWCIQEHLTSDMTDETLADCHSIVTHT